MMVKLTPCICGAREPPRLQRRGTASMLVVLECPRCKRRTPMSRHEYVDRAWNAEMVREHAKALPR